MTIWQLFDLVWRRGWIIVLAAALTATSAFVFSRLQTEVWEATVRILVQPTRPDFGLTTSAKNLLRSYVQWMDTRQNAQRVIDSLKLDLIPENLDRTITSEDENFIIQVDVRSQNMRTASAAAKRWAELFVEWRITDNSRLRREDQVDALILDEPVISRYRPQTTVNTLAGGILGALLGGVIVFVLEYLAANTLRSRQDIERALGLSVLGAVPVLEGGRRKA
ncbi:MAG: Wzz/FepE/Etk N-terminal domain-containing protein [Anaerolineales bacterium]|nr:Wzz/FepE/Etk N-terminal domain-containing protein [Anaerolineales bacterium]